MFCCYLAKYLVLRLTRIAELISDREPSTNDACDTAATGMGGVCFVATVDSEIPLLQRQLLPDWVRTQLSSIKKPNGRITNSNLELVGSIAHNNILAQVANITEKTTHNSYYNIAAVFWQRKGATTTVGPVAFLLCFQTLHQRFFRFVLL